MQIVQEPDAHGDEETTTKESTHEGSEKGEVEAEAKDNGIMSPVDELSENGHATTPTNTSASALRGKARSFVDGVVSGLRSIPRAVTHSQVYDRRSLGRESSRTSHFSYYRPRVSTATQHQHQQAGYNLKYPEQPLPYTVPILLAPPHAFQHGHMGMGMGMRTPRSLSLSKLGSEAAYTTTESHVSGSGGGAHRLSSLLGELNSLPWISTRVAVDYIPGESTRSAPEKRSSSSWYTISAPASPSDISHLERFVPEPWFPPAQLTPTVEVPEEEFGVAGAGEGREPEAEEAERVGKLKEELQDKSQALHDLRQVVEHQKMHISSLESQIEELRQAGEQTLALQRRRSSMRQSLRASQSLRVRDSVRMSTRRTSVRVSRPPSSFFD